MWPLTSVVMSRTLALPLPFGFELLDEEGVGLLL